MFPFSSILSGRSTALDLIIMSVITESTSPGNSRSGIVFKTNGQMAEHRNGIETSLVGDQWIHSDFQGLVDGSAYECRFESLVGDVGRLVAPSVTADAWHALTEDRELRMRDGSTDVQYVITGTIKIRQIAAPTNIASSTFTLQTENVGTG
jgi:hypothetical protein